MHFSICGIRSSAALSKGQWQWTRVLESRLATPSPGSYILIWSLTVAKTSGNPKGGSGRRPIIRSRFVVREPPRHETSLGLLMTRECLTWLVNQRQEAGPCVCMVLNRKHTGFRTKGAGQEGRGLNFPPLLLGRQRSARVGWQELKVSLEFSSVSLPSGPQLGLVSSEIHRERNCSRR